LQPDDALAIQRALEVLQRHSAGAAPSLTVRELFEKYEPWYNANHKGWKSAFASRRNNLLEFFAAIPASTITLTHADEYRKTRATAAAATRNCELATLRSCFGWSVKRRLVAFNPLAGMDMEPTPNARTAFLDEAGFARLLSATASPMARALFVLAFDTGMRREELRDLKRVNVDLEARLVRLGDADCKNGSGRIVPLTERAVETLRTLPTWSAYVFSMDGGPVGKSTIHEWFSTARTRSGIPAAMTFHGLRHSAATLMRRRGVPWPLIKAALGWKSDVAARRYQNYSAEDWVSLRERMDAGIAEEVRKGPQRAASPAGVTSEKNQVAK
jgi:integrase